MFALCEARLRSFTIASKLALYSLARALRRRKFVQMRAECKLVYILPSVAELRLSKHCLLRNVPLIQEGELFLLFSIIAVR